MYQIQRDGPDRVLSYASRTLGKGERKYLPHKLELFVLKWAVTKCFYWNTFDVHINNNPLTYILTTAKLDAPGHC